MLGELAAAGLAAQVFELTLERLDGQRKTFTVGGELDAHVATARELAEQELLGERPLDVLLDDARHRPRTHLRVVAARRDPIASRGLELDRDVVLVELGLELDD